MAAVANSDASVSSMAGQSALKCHNIGVFPYVNQIDILRIAALCAGPKRQVFLFPHNRSLIGDISEV